MINAGVEAIDCEGCTGGAFTIAENSTFNLKNRVVWGGCTGATLALVNEIQLNFAFKNSTLWGKDYTGLYAIATYTNRRGEERKVRIDGVDIGTSRGM